MHQDLPHPDLLHQSKKGDSAFYCYLLPIMEICRYKRRCPLFYFVFTEQGVAMLSGVLKSKRAVLVNIEIMRTFVKFRRMLGTHEKLTVKLDELERKYDSQFKVVFDVIRKLMAPVEAPQRRIGFRKSKS
jgi:hypothetical protein